MSKKAPKVDALELGLTNHRNNLMRQVISLDSIIKKRIDYIVDKICEVFHKKYDFWETNYDECPELLIGEYFDSKNLLVSIGFSSTRPQHMTIYYESKLWDLLDGIPTAWLYNNFEEELISGKQKFDQELKLLKKNEKKLSISKKLDKKECSYVKTE